MKEKFSVSLTPNEALTLRQYVEDRKRAKEVNALPATIKVALGGEIHGLEDEIWRDRYWNIDLQITDIWFDLDGATHLVAKFVPSNGIVIATEVEPGLDDATIKSFRKAFKSWRPLLLSSFKRSDDALVFSNITKKPFGIDMVGETLGVVKSDPGKS